MICESALRDLATFTLPDDIARLSPIRQPFASCSTATLQAAASDVVENPERSGFFPRAVRTTLGIPETEKSGSWTIFEAHLDAAAIRPWQRDFLLTQGFEEDGFYQIVPEHFEAHYTLKFRRTKSSKNAANYFYDQIMSRSYRVISYLNDTTPNSEFYLEVEVYNDKQRMYFPNTSFQQWSTSDLRRDIERSLGELNISEPSPTEVKRADIHVKLSATIAGSGGDCIVRALQKIGFYRVITWGSNTVMTGQFIDVSTAQSFFLRIIEIAKRYGGVSELTLEPAPFVYRSTIVIDDAVTVSSMPPLIRVNSA